MRKKYVYRGHELAIGSHDLLIGLRQHVLLIRSFILCLNRAHAIIIFSPVLLNHGHIVIIPSLVLVTLKRGNDLVQHTWP